MSGKVKEPTSANDVVYEKNLRYAASKFASEAIIGLIEPINNITIPNYYMNNFQKGTKNSIKMQGVTIIIKIK
jgi:hydroxypyruvate isomerase